MSSRTVAKTHAAELTELQTNSCTKELSFSPCKFYSKQSASGENMDVVVNGSQKIKLRGPDIVEIPRCEPPLDDGESICDDVGNETEKGSPVLGEPCTSDSVGDVTLNGDVSLPQGKKKIKKKMLYSFLLLSSHILVKKQTKLYRCDVCGATYRHVFSLKRHFLRNHINVKYISKSDLSNCKIHVPDGHQSAESDSDVSSVSSRGSSTKKRHRTKAEGDPNVAMSGLFRCHLCKDIKFDTKQELRVHFQKHPTTSKLRFPCSKCDAVFSHKQTLFKHASTHAGASRFPCAVCGKSFESKILYAKHAVTHAESNKCKYCSKVLSTKANRRRHERIHEGLKPYPCKYCPSQFGQSGDLKKHLKKEHGVSYLSCPYCFSMFSAKTSLNKHVADRHASKIESLPLKRKLRQPSPGKLVRTGAGNSSKEDQDQETERVPGFSHFRSIRSVSEAKARGSGKAFSCTVCKKSCSTYISMLSHRRQSHPFVPRARRIHKRQKYYTRSSAALHQQTILRKKTPPRVTEEEFYKSVSRMIADNLLNFVDGKTSQLSLRQYNFSDQLEQQSAIPRQPWTAYNFPSGFDVEQALQTKGHEIKNRTAETSSTDIAIANGFSSFVGNFDSYSEPDLLRNSNSEPSDCEDAYFGNPPYIDYKNINVEERRKMIGKEVLSVVLCCVCKEKFPSHEAFESHSVNNHPNVLCTSIEIQGDKDSPPEVPEALRWQFLSSEGACFSCIVPPPISEKGCVACTKCGAKFTKASDLHEHIIACSGSAANVPRHVRKVFHERKIKRTMKSRMNTSVKLAGSFKPSSEKQPLPVTNGEDALTNDEKSEEVGSPAANVAFAKPAVGRPKTNLNLICQHCKQTFRTKGLLNAHVNRCYKRMVMRNRCLRISLRKKPSTPTVNRQVVKSEPSVPEPDCLSILQTSVLESLASSSSPEAAAEQTASSLSCNGTMEVGNSVSETEALMTAMPLAESASHAKQTSVACSSVPSSPIQAPIAVTTAPLSEVRSESSASTKTEAFVKSTEGSSSTKPYDCVPAGLAKPSSSLGTLSNKTVQHPKVLPSVSVTSAGTKPRAAKPRAAETAKSPVQFPTHVSAGAAKSPPPPVCGTKVSQPFSFTDAPPKKPLAVPKTAASMIQSVAAIPSSKSTAIAAAVGTPSGVSANSGDTASSSSKNSTFSASNSVQNSSQQQVRRPQADKISHAATVKSVGSTVEPKGHEITPQKSQEVASKKVCSPLDFCEPVSHKADASRERLSPSLEVLVNSIKEKLTSEELNPNNPSFAWNEDEDFGVFSPTSHAIAQDAQSMEQAHNLSKVPEAGRVTERISASTQSLSSDTSVRESKETVVLANTSCGSNLEVASKVPTPVGLVPCPGTSRNDAVSATVALLNEQNHSGEEVPKRESLSLAESDESVQRNRRLSGRTGVDRSRSPPFRNTGAGPPQVDYKVENDDKSATLKCLTKTGNSAAVDDGSSSKSVTCSTSSNTMGERNSQAQLGASELQGSALQQNTEDVKPDESPLEPEGTGILRSISDVAQTSREGEPSPTLCQIPRHILEACGLPLPESNVAKNGAADAVPSRSSDPSERSTSANNVAGGIAAKDAEKPDVKMEAITKSRPKKYKCPCCVLEFAYLSNFRRHVAVCKSKQEQREKERKVREEERKRKAEITMQPVSSACLLHLPKKDEVEQSMLNLLRNQSRQTQMMKEAKPDDSEDVKKFQTYTCDICHRIFLSLFKLLQHRVVHKLKNSDEQGATVSRDTGGTEMQDSASGILRPDAVQPSGSQPTPPPTVPETFSNSSASCPDQPPIAAGTSNVGVSEANREEGQTPVSRSKVPRGNEARVSPAVAPEKRYFKSITDAKKELCLKPVSIDSSTEAEEVDDPVPMQVVSGEELDEEAVGASASADRVGMSADSLPDAKSRAKDSFSGRTDGSSSRSKAERVPMRIKTEDGTVDTGTADSRSVKDVSPSSKKVPSSPSKSTPSPAAPRPKQTRNPSPKDKTCPFCKKVFYSLAYKMKHVAKMHPRSETRNKKKESAKVPVVKTKVGVKKKVLLKKGIKKRRIFQRECKRLFLGEKTILKSTFLRKRKK